MSSGSDQSEKSRAQRTFNLTLAAVVTQVGCLTLVILLAALFGGLWLDQIFQTKPMFTLGLTIASIPVTLIVMLWIVRSATSRLKSGPSEDSKNEE
jgi:ABC-type transport system involved in cytochrome c biogenesis permease subunit